MSRSSGEAYLSFYSPPLLFLSCINYKAKAEREPSILHHEFLVFFLLHLIRL